MLQTAASQAVYWLDLEPAIDYGERSLVLNQRFGHTASCIAVLHILCFAAQLLGKEPLFQQYAVQGLSLARRTGDRQLIFRAANELARVAHLSGDDVVFACMEQECDSLSACVSAPNRVSRMAHQLRVHVDRDRWEPALIVASDLEIVARERGLDYWLVTVVRERAYIALLRRNMREAMALMAEGMSLCELLEDPAQEGMTLHFYSLVELGCGRPEVALRHAIRGVACLRTMRDHAHLAIALTSVGAAALGADLGMAASAYAEVLRLFRTLSSSARGTQVAIAACVTGIALCSAKHAPKTDNEPTARLCGAASRLQHEQAGRYALATLGMPLPDLDLARDDLIANCRTALGDAAFEQAWEAGRALSWEQAVDEALATTESTAW